MKPQQVKEPYGTRHVMAPIIVPKIATAAKCAVPVCESCLLGISKKRSPGVSKVKAVPEKEGISARDKYEVGYFVSTDKFLCSCLEDFHIYMVVNVSKIDFTAVPSIMTPRLV